MLGGLVTIFAVSGNARSRASATGVAARGTTIAAVDLTALGLKAWRAVSGTARSRGSATGVAAGGALLAALGRGAGASH